MKMAPSQSSASRDGAYQKLLNILSAVTAPKEPLALLQEIGGILLDMLEVDAILFARFVEGGHMAELTTIAWNPSLPAFPAFLLFERKGTATEEAFARKQPVAIPDLSEMMQHLRQLSSYAHLAVHRCAYVFPIATKRTVFGALIFASAEGRRFHPDDMKLMSCVSSQVAVTLEAERANAEVTTYQKRLEQERDRLGLLLDINNQIVTQTTSMPFSLLRHSAFASTLQTILRASG